MKSRYSAYPYRIRKSDAEKMPAISPEKLKQMKKDVEKYLSHKESERGWISRVGNNIRK